MFINWLRTNVYASFLLLLTRLYIGWDWTIGGWEKVTGDFNASSFLQKAVDKPVISHDAIVYPTYHAFLKNIAYPYADWFSFAVSWGELLVGIGLILGCFTIAAAFFGITMNFAFLLAGTISSNPWMILLTLFLLVGGRNTGHFGLDRYFMPYFKKWLSLKKKSL